MNAKFFDLKQDKQDRMINAALKIFALNGYTHASTDEIVKEAHISKGLLFHYFESKIGAYAFVYDYSARYMALEFSTAVDPSETSYMVIRKQMEAARMQTLKNYPYMQLFLSRCDKETCPEALLAIESQKHAYENSVGTFLARADMNELKEIPNSFRYLKMLDSTLDCLMEEKFRENSFNADDYFNEALEYMSITDKLLKK